MIQFSTELISNILLIQSPFKFDRIQNLLYFDILGGLSDLEKMVSVSVRYLFYQPRDVKCMLFTL